MAEIPIDLAGVAPPDEPASLPHWKDEPLLGPAHSARTNPRQWVWVASGSPDPAGDVQWVREIIRGDRQALGGTAEKWNAVVVAMVVRDDRWVTVERAGAPAPDEPVTVHRFIAFLGARTSGA